MRKHIVLVLLAVMIGLAGCSSANDQKPQTASQNKQAEITLYYANSDNSGFVTENRTIIYNEKNNIYKMALQELLKGPSGDDAYLRVPKGTDVKDVKFSDGIATADLSGFTGFGGTMDEAMARASIVNTLTGLDGVKKVAITVDGKDYIGASGNPMGPMSHMDISDTKTYKIYFSDSDAENLVPEMRTLEKGKDPASGIVEELIEGPIRSDLVKTMPEGTKLISLKIKDGIAYVNLSKEFKQISSGGSTGETMALYSVIDSLTELPDIKEVQFLIEGKKADTSAGHYDLSDPLERDPFIIKEGY